MARSSRLSTAFDIVDTHTHISPTSESGSASAESRDVDSVNAADLAEILLGQSVPRCILVIRDAQYGTKAASENPAVFRLVVTLDSLARNGERRAYEYLENPYVVGLRVMQDGGSPLDSVPMATWQWLAKSQRPLAIYAPNEIGNLGDIAAKVPSLQLIVDHAGLDFTSGRDPLRNWRRLSALSALENVAIKISGLVQVSDTDAGSMEGLIDQLLGWFGPERLMWGSNFPPSSHVLSYADGLHRLASALRALSDRERGAILGGTADAIYGIW
jgi:L-fuconolactonase